MGAQEEKYSPAPNVTIWEKTGRVSVLALVATFAALPDACAQVIVNAPGAEPGAGIALAGPDYEIRSDSGTVAGGNLFQSFESFSLSELESATWRPVGMDRNGIVFAASSIRTIINRVTSGSGSVIDGHIDSMAYANADFYFIDPRGVLIGGSARLDVPRSLYLSTASALNLSDGGVYSASRPIDTRLTMGAPESFGFFTPPEELRISGTHIRLAEGSDLGVVGGNITIAGDSFDPNGSPTIDVASGRVLIAGVEQSAGFSIQNPTANLTGQTLGNVSVSGGAKIFGDATAADPTAAGLYLIGRDISLADFVQLTSDNVSAQPGGRAVLIASGDAALSNGAVFRSAALNSGDTFGVSIEVAGDLQVDGSQLPPSQRSTGIFSVSQPRADVAAGGNAGPLDLRAGTILLLNGGQLASFSSSRGGEIARISISAGSLTLNGGTDDNNGWFSGIVNSLQAGSLATLAPELAITSGALNINDGASISSLTLTDAPGGAILITGNPVISIDGGGGTSGSTGIFAHSGNEPVHVSSGHAGTIAINAQSIAVIDGGEIMSDTFSRGAAGAVQINVRGALTVSGVGSNDQPTGIFSQANSQANGSPGRIDIAAGTVVVSGGASISTKDLGLPDGAGGPSMAGVTITAEQSITVDDALVSSETQGAFDGGVVTLSAAMILVSGQSSSTGVRTSTISLADAGSIIIHVSDNLDVSGVGGLIASTSRAAFAGKAGSIVINAPDADVVLSGGGTVSTSSEATSRTAGSISIDASTITVTGGGGSALTASRVESASIGASGNAGAIDISASRIGLAHGGRINTNSVSGQAGDIAIQLPTGGMLAITGGSITTTASPQFSTVGSGGRISIAEPLAIILEGGRIEALGRIASADVQVSSLYLLEATEPRSAIAVNGQFVLDARLGDVTAGAKGVEAAFQTASETLRSQCRQQQRGSLSTLNYAETGVTGTEAPRGREPEIGACTLDR